MRRSLASALLLAVSVLALAAFAAGCSTSGDGDASRPTATDAGASDGPGPTADPGSSDETTTTPQRTSRFGDLEPSDLSFRPVLEVLPCDAETVDTTAATGAQVAPEGDRVPSTDGLTCYQLGPVAGDGRDLSTATAELGPDGNWMVTVTPKGSSREALNELFNACYDAEATCPPVAGDRGSVAIVLGDEVASAPAVNGEDLADDAFQISGSFTEAEARDLAAILND